MAKDGRAGKALGIASIGSFIAGTFGVLPSRKDLRQSAGPIARGSLLGSILGVLPGNGVILASFAAYALEKRLARDRHQGSAQPVIG
jgi:putative tricarboxylic transport membrane protein